MTQSWFRARLGASFIAAALSLPLTAPAAHAASLVLYSAQHEQVVDMLAKDFQKESGISVKIRSGEGPALAAQLVAEGSATPADVYFTENSPELMLLEEKGMLAKVTPATLATIPARDSA
jgi:iron(III) transport system substrate-binding protein